MSPIALVVFYNKNINKIRNPDQFKQFESKWSLLGWDQCIMFSGFDVQAYIKNVESAICDRHHDFKGWPYNLAIYSRFPLVY
jgi:hypothetical protein